MEGEQLARHIQTVNTAGEQYIHIPGTVPGYEIEYDALSPLDLAEQKAIFEIFGENGLNYFSVIDFNPPIIADSKIDATRNAKKLFK